MRLAKQIPPSERRDIIKAAQTILDESPSMIDDAMEDTIQHTPQKEDRSAAGNADFKQGIAVAMLDAARRIRAVAERETQDSVMLTACRAALMAAETEACQTTDELERRRAAAAAAASKRLATETVRFF